jgi:hypothetical protein
VAIEPFHAIVVRDGETFAVGGNLTTTSGDYYGTIAHYGPPLGTLTPTPCE